MREEDYPRLHCASDQVARHAQRNYYGFLAAQLGLFLAVGLVGTVARALPDAMQRAALAFVPILLFAAIVITLVARERKLDKRWFDARAVAESTKTAAWRYMMGSAPFNVSDDVVDQAFVQELHDILRERSGLQEHLAGLCARSPVISQQMRDCRASSLDTRRGRYLVERVRDQIGWYSGKAAWNLRRKEIWSWAGLGLQLIAFILATLSAAYRSLPVNFVGILMTLAASGTAWAQAKRHDELPNSYGLAAQELEEIAALIEGEEQEPTFLELVDQAEEAVSREHTMWCARRSIRAPGYDKGGA